MYCPGCRNEIYLVDNFNNINWLYCENCGQSHSIRSHGSAPKRKRLESMQKSYFQQEVRTSRPVKVSAINRKSKVKMNNPGNMINESPGKLQAVAF